MTELEIGITGFAVLGVLIYSGLHISTALLSVAFVGVWLIKGDINTAGNLLAIAATDAVAEYEFGTIPLFVLMGFLVMVAGVGADSYAVAHRALTGVPGGLGHATVIRFSRAGWRVFTCSRHPFPEQCPWDAGP